jgi:hypothetical protein
MKNIFNKAYLLMFAIIALALNACVEPEATITDYGVAGGLVDPQVSNFPYKIGATTTFDIGVEVPMGPGIESIEVTKVFVTVDGDESNTVLLSTVPVASANTSGVMETSFTLDYAELRKGITINGKELPVEDVDLIIGDSWVLSYTAVMAGDSRIVLNNATTNIGVANKYAGDYQVTGTFNHPTSGVRAINEEKYLTAINATTSLSYAGDLAGYGTDYDIFIIVNEDNSVTVKGTPDTVTDIIMDGVNEYDPVTGVFTLNYYYVGSTGNRIMSEVYTPL